jgi:opacity protein-like surface antigen
MKRFITILSFLALSTLQARAQETESEDDMEVSKKGTQLRVPTGVGHYLVGANLVFANATFQKDFETSYDIGLNPKVGYFVLPNIALGLSGNIAVSGNKSYHEISYGVSPFARVYFAHDNADKPARPLQFFVEGGVGFGGSNTRYESGSGVTKASTNGLRLYLLPGVDYFINDHIAAELGFEYLFIAGDPDAHIIALNLGFQIFLGR